MSNPVRGFKEIGGHSHLAVNRLRRRHVSKKQLRTSIAAPRAVATDDDRITVVDTLRAQYYRNQRDDVVH